VTWGCGSCLGDFLGAAPRRPTQLQDAIGRLHSPSGDEPEGGGLRFPLPPPGRPRQDSLHNPPLPIPNKNKQLYIAAAGKYKIPWTLLAGIGMEENGHGRNNHTSSAGAQGLMQFMPGTWASMGVDGDGDGSADIHNDADSIHSAAHYLTKSGVSTRGR
jgi:membrane-bound lytic murein transglycosylase B